MMRGLPTSMDLWKMVLDLRMQKTELPILDSLRYLVHTPNLLESSGAVYSRVDTKS